MKKAKVLNSDDVGTEWGWGIGWACKEEEGEFRIVNSCVSSCRSYLQDVMIDKKNEDHLLGGKDSKFIGKGGTYLFTYQSADMTTQKKGISERLEKLNEKLEKFGIEHTEIFQVTLKNGSKGFIFSGDVEWSDSLWKMSLYSYYLKKVLFSTCDEYDHVLKNGNEEKFLKKVKNFPCLRKENKRNYIEWHAEAGFVSIATKENEKMYNLIFGEKV